MPLSPKDVRCRCGHVSSLNLRKMRCIKCGKFIFYNEEEERRHKTTQFYTVAMLVAAIGIITYLFIEMIVDPLLG